MTMTAVSEKTEPAVRTTRPARPLPGRVWDVVSRTWFFVAVVILWWVLSANSTSTFFPPLRDIVQRFYELWIVGDTASTLKASLVNFVIGYGGASVLGVAFGALLWRFTRIAHAVSPLLYFIYVIPSVAMLPAVIAVMGIGSGMKITIIILAAIWPTLLNTLDGMQGIDAIKLDTAKVLHMSSLRTVRSVVLPGALPQIMAGLRHSLQIAVIMMVVSELVASTSGIGFFILDAQQRFAFTDMWTGIIVLALIGSALTFLFIAVERVVLAWYIGARAVEEKG
ncbi:MULTISPECIES: ABC transporter permease [unclassified Micromonospora]|uniref:ABC transporter permease n=1 Tax=unclassified Micromonospora TaxID=2617518 RepID=UPI0033B630B1